MPSTYNGCGTSIYRDCGVVRWGKGEGGTQDFDAIEAVCLFNFPVFPLRAVHVHRWRKGETRQEYGETIEESTYKVFSIRSSYGLVIRAMLRYWLWLPIIFYLPVGLVGWVVNPLLALFSLLVGLPALGGMFCLWNYESRSRSIRLLLGRHGLGSSDPATWTDDILERVVRANEWFGTRTFAKAVEPLLDDGFFSEAMWAARLSLALEDPDKGQRLTEFILEGPDVQDMLARLKEDPQKGKKLLKKQKDQRFPLLYPEEEDDAEEERPRPRRRLKERPAPGMAPELVVSICSGVLLTVFTISFIVFSRIQHQAANSPPPLPQAAGQKSKNDPPPANQPAMAEPPEWALQEEGWQYLTELDEFDVQKGPWPFTKNGQVGDGKTPIQINGVPSPNGLGMHPSTGPGSAVKYRLHKKEALFKTAVAINDSGKPSFGPAVFEIFGDGQLLWQSKPVPKSGQVQTCTLLLKDVDILQLRVRALTSHLGLHAVWLEPQLKWKME
jgi:hypothetical protein